MLIGLSGELGSGKDTACEILSDFCADYYPEVEVIRDAFADRLKISAVRSLFGDHIDGQEAVSLANVIKNGGQIHVDIPLDDIVIAETDDPDGIRPAYWTKTITGREYLQHYGTEGHRDVFDQDFWINAVLPDSSDYVNYGRKDMEKLNRPDIGQQALLVVTDVRFPNEARAIRVAGGEIWKIDRESTKIGSTHASEIPLQEQLVNRVIPNNGSLEEFSDTLFDALRQVFNGPR